MTKTVKLTQNYINKLPTLIASGIKFENDKHFLHIPLVQLAEGESYRKADIVNDCTKVPIYIIPEEVSKKYMLLKQAIPEEELATYIARHEGSNATPPTADILYYGCNCGETMEIPTDIVDNDLIGIVEEVI